MFTIKHIVVFFIIQSTVVPSCYIMAQWEKFPFHSKSVESVVTTYFDYSSEEDIHVSLESEPITSEDRDTYEYISVEVGHDSVEEESITSDESDLSEYSSEEDGHNSVEEESISIDEHDFCDSEHSSQEDGHNKLEEKPIPSDVPNSNNTQKYHTAYNCSDKEDSLISHSDIQYLIEHKADLLKIKETLVNNYYPEGQKIYEKYVKELEELREHFEDRPEHMLDILLDMASYRQRLEPLVEEIANQLDEFSTVESNYNKVAERSAMLLNQLDKYEKLCSFNCDNHNIEYRLRVRESSVSKNDSYCVKLKDLNDYIDEKLTQEEEQYDHDLHHELQIKDETFAQKLSELKVNLKEAAVKEFGMTMYDMLSLQDDYHHFAEKLENISISSEILKIEENVAEIKLKLIGMKRDVEKYRQYCMKCNINQRVKRNVLPDSTKENKIDTWPDVVDELLKAKIDENKEAIKSNFTILFETLNKELNDPDVSAYLTKLKPIQSDIQQEIQKEQDALHQLSNRIPVSSIDNILKLSKQSQDIIQNLESSKAFIDMIINRY